MTGRTINGLATTPAPSSTQRPATVSAADALDDLGDDLGDGSGGTAAAHVPTGLAALDWALADLDPGAAARGGVARGQLTEIWGPPGVGKTAMGIQLAANAVVDGHDVVWTASTHCTSRACGPP
jgi:replicative DNA helicase